MREILVDWTTPAGSGFRSVLYFSESPTVTFQRSALGTFLGAVDALLDSNVVWAVETSGRTIDPATGTLTGAWSEATPQTGAGATAGQCVPDAAHILARWNTTTVVAGRFLKGRTFIPGLSTANVLEGNIAVAALATINSAINSFISSTAELQVWHRPAPGGGGGQAVNVTSGSAWAEFAVLRQRRG